MRITESVNPIAKNETSLNNAWDLFTWLWFKTLYPQ